MLAKDKQEHKPEVAATEVAAPAVQEPSSATFQTEGNVPAVKRETGAKAPATASQQAFEGKRGDTSALDHGVHQPDEYKRACESANAQDKWKEQYRGGYTKSTAWSHNPKNGMKFDLKKGQSASEAIRDWFKGPTIADFRTISVAEQLDELRDELGDQKFDQLFGSADGAEDKLIPGGQRLQISLAMYTTPFIDQMKAVAKKHDEKINKPEAETPEATTSPQEEKQPRPGKHAQAKHDTEYDQDNDLASQREMGFGREDLQRM